MHPVSTRQVARRLQVCQHQILGAYGVERGDVGRRVHQEAVGTRPRIRQVEVGRIQGEEGVEICWNH